jgi:hypothetical protein
MRISADLPSVRSICICSSRVQTSQLSPSQQGRIAVSVSPFPTRMHARRVGDSSPSAESGCARLASGSVSPKGTNWRCHLLTSAACARFVENLEAANCQRSSHSSEKEGRTKTDGSSASRPSCAVAGEVELELDHAQQTNSRRSTCRLVRIVGGLGCSWSLVWQIAMYPQTFSAATPETTTGRSKSSGGNRVLMRRVQPER